MNLKGLKQLGCEVRPFGLDAFADFIPEKPAREFYGLVCQIAEKNSIKHETLRVQISLRPDLHNAVQFICTGPHERPGAYKTLAPKLHMIALRYPERSVPVTFDHWAEIGAPFGAHNYWSHMLEIEGEKEPTS